MAVTAVFAVVMVVAVAVAAALEVMAVTAVVAEARLGIYHAANIGPTSLQQRLFHRHTRSVLADLGSQGW